MSPQVDLDDELDYPLRFRPLDGAERNRAGSINFGVSSAQRYANQARHSRQRLKTGQSGQGIHRRGGKKGYE